MKAVVDSVLPLFALILAGYLCGLRGVLGPGATDSLNRFVVWLALPALLFQAVAQARWAEVNHPAFALSIAAGMLGTFGLWVGVSLRWSRGRGERLPDASIEGLAASYPNTGFMGIPLCLSVFGRDGLPPAIIATILTACLLFGLSLALIEIGLQRAQGTARALRKAGASLARNPLLIAPALGLAVAIAGAPLPSALIRFTSLLGAAASPSALVTIGLFLAQSRRLAGDQAQSAPLPPPRARGRVILGIVALKMLLQPLITGALVFGVFHLPRLWSNAALLLSALPIGTGPFMLAKLYDREAAVTSRAILLSTLLSVLTISLLVAWIGHPQG
jgi:malonate transporter and related proteins